VHLETSSTCIAGGTRVVSYLDTNSNKVFDVATDTTLAERQICNGENGAQGENGLSSFAQTRVATSAECASGGSVLQLWLDSNKSGRIDTGDTLQGETPLCGAAQPVITSTEIATGTGDCSGAGGTKIFSYLDVNKNGAYDAAVDSEMTDNAICNGARDAALLTTADLVASTQCASGKALETTVYRDANANGVVDSGESLLNSSLKCSALCFTVNAATAPKSTDSYAPWGAGFVLPERPNNGAWKVSSVTGTWANSAGITPVSSQGVSGSSMLASPWGERACTPIQSLQWTASGRSAALVQPNVVIPSKTQFVMAMCDHYYASQYCAGESYNPYTGHYYCYAYGTNYYNLYQYDNFGQMEVCFEPAQ
jgi:hypothetical protein